MQGMESCAELTKSKAAHTVARMILDMPEITRKLMVLCVYESASLPDAAAALGIPLDDAEDMYFAAVNEIKDVIEDATSANEARDA